jgi:hypothetical protein
MILDGNLVSLALLSFHLMIFTLLALGMMKVIQQAMHVLPLYSYTARHRAEMIKQAKTTGLIKLKTTALILALILCIPITATTASQILIEDADTIWNVTSDYPPKLINTTDNVTPRVTIEYANTIYHNVLAFLTGLSNVTNIVTPRITAEHANTVYCADLDKVPAALANLSQTVVSSRLIFVSANTNHCEELIYPKEFMDDTIAPRITDISVISLANNSAKVTWKTDEFTDSVLKYGVNSTAYTETCIDVLFVKGHEITLTGLSPDTIYYFVVNSRDQSGNSAESSKYSFKYDW